VTRELAERDARLRPRLVIFGPERKGGSPISEDDVIRLSANEIRRLLATLVLTPRICLDSAIDWSIWHRRHQHQECPSHYRRRDQHPP
jgi:hypothetical protein